MLKRLSLTLLVLATVATPCLAQSQFESTAVQGSQGYSTSTTGSGPMGTGRLSTYTSGPQSSVSLPTGFGQLAGAPPPTVLDSFVKNSGYNDMIYGDESIEGPPPYFDFLPIGAGMGGAGASNTGGNYGALTTGHQSTTLPSINGSVLGPMFTAAQAAAVLSGLGQQALTGSVGVQGTPVSINGVSGF